jgi:TonB-linked SusC/RagA family outer membrane protein
MQKGRFIASWRTRQAAGLTRLAMLSLSITAAALVFASPALAQGRPGTIEGRVVEQTGTPIPSVQVQVLGTNLGAQTSQEGRYTIRGVPSGTQRIRYVRIGFAEVIQVVRVPEGGSVTADTTMRAIGIQLSPVVTTATGQQLRNEVGNSIAQVNAPELVEKGPIATLSDLLTARASGVQVIPPNSTGAGARVRIRGTSSLSLSNDPIYIIDGIRMQSSTNSTALGLGGTTPSRANDINPEEIESIEIVKGPSAATLYGTDAANGVIVITTKRGLSGRPRWTFFTEQGMVEDRNPWPDNYNALGTYINETNPALRQTAYCALFEQGLPTTDPGYCQLDSLATFNPAKNSQTSPLGTGYRHQYGAQLSGGSDMVRYFTSGDWEEEIGLQKLPTSERNRLREANIPIRDLMERPNQYTKGAARANINVSLPRNAELGFNAGFIRSHTTLPRSDNNSQGWGPTLLGGLGLVDPDDLTQAYGFYNLGNVYQAEYGQDINRFIGSINGNWGATNWLSFRSNVGMDYTGRTDTQLCRVTECTSNAQREGYKNDARTTFQNYTVDLSGTAAFQPLPSVGTKTSVGVQFYRDVFNRNGAYGSRLPPGAVTVTDAAVPASDEASTESRTLGAFIEQSVSWNERLFVTAAVRSDDNSAFGNNFDAVYYPKLSVSWVASDEPFMPRFDWLNQVRLRAAYGASGRQPNNTDALQFFTTQTANIRGTESPGLIFNALGNPELKPERSTELETGVDFSLLSNRVNVELTYYDKHSKDALIQEIIPPSVGTGATTRLSNIGEVRNWGWEGRFDSQLLTRQNFGWDFGINGSYNSNKIVSLGGTPPQFATPTDQNAQVEGFPLNAFFLRPYTYDDANGNGIIDLDEVVVGDDPVYAGYSQPRTELAFNSGVTFWQRRLRLSALADYKGGFKVWNGTERYRCVSFANCQDLFDPSTPLWRQARVIAGGFVTNTTDYGYVEDASFFRLREVALTFDLPQSWVSRALRGGASRASVTLSGRNLHVWTDYTGIDPESNYAQNDVQNDFLTQPPATYYTLRINLGFGSR